MFSKFKEHSLFGKRYKRMTICSFIPGFTEVLTE